MTTTNKIKFTVQVSIENEQANYSFFDEQGEPCSGGAQVTERNTVISYTLSNSPGVIFSAPIVNGDTGHDITFSLSSDKQKLSLLDSDTDAEEVCLQLVVAQSTDPQTTYPSPDPQIINRPGRG